MRLEVSKPTGRGAGSALIYRPDEYSFDFELPIRDFTSLLVNDVQLEVDESGRVISVWGYCPYVSWIQSELTPPVVEAGDVMVQPSGTLESAASVPLTENRRMPVLADPASGWVYISSGEPHARSVQLFRDVILQLTQTGEFAALWLRPQQLPTKIGS